MNVVGMMVELLGLFGGIVAILILATSLERWLGMRDRPRVNQPFERPLVRVVRRIDANGRVPREGVGARPTRGSPSRAIRIIKRSEPEAPMASAPGAVAARPPATPRSEPCATW